MANPTAKSDTEAIILTNFTNARNTFGRGTPQLLQVLRTLMEFIEDELVAEEPLEPAETNGLRITKANIESEMRLCTAQVEPIEEKMASLKMD